VLTAMLGLLLLTTVLQDVLGYSPSSEAIALMPMTALGSRSSANGPGGSSVARRGRPDGGTAPDAARSGSRRSPQESGYPLQY